MFRNNVQVLTMAHAMVAHAATRQNQISHHIANADTPGFQRREVQSFQQVWQGIGGDLRQTRSGHLQTDKDRSISSRVIATHQNPNGNSVSIEHEMRLAVEVRQAHDMALAIHKSLSSSIRSTLGRRG